MATTGKPETAYHPFEGGSVPRSRKRSPSKWLTPGRFCLLLCGLLGFLCTSFVTFAVYKAAREASRIVSLPHIDKHANASLVAPHGVVPIETDVVRPFFGLQKDGGVDTFDLKASIWARVPQPETQWNASAWELVHDATVVSSASIDAKVVRAVEQVRLPKTLVHDLAKHQNASLMASFVMVPSAERIDPSLRYHGWQTARNASAFGVNALLPPLSTEMVHPPDDILRHFLANAGAARNLLLRASENWDLRERARMNGTSADELFPTRHLLSTTHVAMANDFSVYNFTAYNKTLTRRTQFLRDSCTGGRFAHACQRSFRFAGHFENLIEFDNTVDGTSEIPEQRGWRYGPFLTTLFGVPGTLDHRAIHGNETEDVVFDWNIVFAPVSPGKLSLGPPTIGAFEGLVSTPHDKTTIERATGQDTADALNVLIGLPASRGSRPLLLFCLETVTEVAVLAEVPFELHYWASRLLATGITLPVTVLVSAYSVVQILVDLVIQYRTPPVSVPIGGILHLSWTVVLLFFQASLLFRVEWQWGGPGNWVPTGFTRRLATHSERASARADARFDWRLRVALGLIAGLLFRFGNSIPPVLRGSQLAVQSSMEDLAESHYTLNPLRSIHTEPALRILVDLSQLHLIYTLGVFASEYRPIAFLKLATALLVVVPRCIWNWHARPDVTVGQLVWLATEFAFCYSACRFPPVKQEEEEEE